MKLDSFERQMISHVLNQKPVMTIRGTLIIIVLILTLIYAAIDCGIFLSP
jgi:hypothetical protein